MTKTKLIVLAMVAVSLFAGFAGAATYTFTGPGGGAWDQASNWSPSGPPGAADTAVFDLGGSSWSTTISSLQSVASITLQNSGNPLTLGGTGSLTVSGGITGGAVSLTGGTLTLAGSGNSITSTVGAGANLNVTGSSGSGQITLLSGGTLSGSGSVSGPVVLGNGLAPTNGNPVISGTLTINGTVSLSANNDSYTAIPGGTGTIGTLVFANGVITRNSLYVIDCAASGNNDLLIFKGTNIPMWPTFTVEMDALPGFASTTGTSSYAVMQTPDAGMTFFNPLLGTRPINAYLTYGLAAANKTVFVTVTRTANIPDFSWTGLGGNTNWDQPGNWSLAGIAPIAGDTAALDLTANPTVTINSARAAGSLNLSSAGTLTLGGTGTLTLGNAITVSAGQTLKGTAALAAPVTLSGGKLAGPMSVTGNVTSTGGTIAPAPTSTTAGTLSIMGNLVLDGNSAMSFNLGAPGTVGGGVSDLIAITGNLTLDGTLNVNNLTGFNVGTYDLISVTGAITDNGLTKGTMPTVGGYGYYIIVGAHTVSLMVTGPPYPPGDVNHDTLVNAADIDAIYQHFGVSYPSQWKVAPGNNPVGQEDVTYWLTQIEHEMYREELGTYTGFTNYGDANLDGFTDFLDFQVLLDYWQGASGWAQGNFNRLEESEFVTDFRDFQVLLDYWNPTGWNNQNPVPEPASLSLLALGALALLRRNRT